MKLNRVVYRFWHNKSARGRVGYVGKDSYYPLRADLVKRSKHKGCKLLYRALNKYPVRFWRVEVLASGFRSDKTLCKSEICWIKKFDSKNKGYNLTDGGEGLLGHKFSIEHRRKMSINSTGNKSFLGRKHTSETKKKMSLAQKGKMFSAEHRANLSEANKGRPGPMLGKHHSKESKAKMSRAHKGKVLSVEHREKIGKAGIGKKHSIKTRKQMSKTNKIRWVKRKASPTKRKLDKIRFAKLSILGSHASLHVNRGIINLNCDLCIAAQVKLNGEKEGTDDSRGSGSPE
jgi:group I intron endonuclease